MQNIGFLSFGWWSNAQGSQVRSAAETLNDTVRLAEAAEDAGMDGAWIRVHHWEQNLASPFPILTAMGRATSRIELGTGVINMRYENPLYMAELAATSDLLGWGAAAAWALARVTGNAARRARRVWLPPARRDDAS